LIYALLLPAWQSNGCMLDCQVRGLRFKPRAGQTFLLRFLLHVCTTTSPLGPQVKWIPESVPSLELV